MTDAPSHLILGIKGLSVCGIGIAVHLFLPP